MRLRVGKRRWTVIVKPDLKDDSGETVCGLCDYPDVPNKSIQLNADLPDEHLVLTALHEVLHAGAINLAHHRVESISAAQLRLLKKLGFSLKRE